MKTYKDGICHEDEEFYDNETYNDLMKLILNSEIQLNIDSSERTRFLSKTRYVYKTNTKANFEGEERYIKWEIDSFNFPLVIAEIEIPDMDYKFEIPDFIADNVLYEVTGIKELSNRNLSEIVYKYKE